MSRLFLSRNIEDGNGRAGQAAIAADPTNVKAYFRAAKCCNTLHKPKFAVVGARGREGWPLSAMPPPPPTQRRRGAHWSRCDTFGTTGTALSRGCVRDLRFARRKASKTLSQLTKIWWSIIIKPLKGPCIVLYNPLKCST